MLEIWDADEVLREYKEMYLKTPPTKEEVEREFGFFSVMAGGFLQMGLPEIADRYRIRADLYFCGVRQIGCVSNEFQRFDNPRTIQRNLFTRIAYNIARLLK